MICACKNCTACGTSKWHDSCCTVRPRPHPRHKSVKSTQHFPEWCLAMRSSTACPVAPCPCTLSQDRSVSQNCVGASMPFLGSDVSIDTMLTCGAMWRVNQVGPSSWLARAPKLEQPALQEAPVTGVRYTHTESQMEETASPLWGQLLYSRMHAVGHAW